MASSVPSRRPDDSFRSALAASNFLIETRPSAKAFSDRGNLYETTFDYAHAIADYTRAIELDPTAADAYSTAASPMPGPKPTHWPPRT